MLNHGIAVDDVVGVNEHLNKVNLDLKIVDGEQRVILNGEDISDRIRTQEISMGASTVSKIKEVRLKLVAMQRELADKYDSIFDGRDMGSYVLPNADHKFYVTADVDVRAKRRYLELKNKGMEANLKKVKEEMIARDEQDSSRAFAPLVIPQGAFVIDTSNMSIEEVENIILNKIKK
jgi:cytidylate kinase